MIRAAHISHLRKESPFDEGVSAQPAPKVDRAKLVQQQQVRIEELRDHTAITVLKGEARFVDGHNLTVKLNNGDEQTVYFECAFIGTGAWRYGPA